MVFLVLLSVLLLLTVLLGCCYLPVAFLFHEKNRPLTFAHVWLYLAAGMGLLGIAAILCRYLGLDMRFGVLPGISMTIFGLIKNRLSGCMPRMSLTGLKDPGAVFALCASMISFSYIFIFGLYMGLGPYPAVFYNVDTPYYLGQIHALLRYESWPPPSLSFLGGAKGYHYGSQAVCAVLAKLSGLAPHTVAFLVYMPVVQLAVISTVWLIAGNLEKKISFRWWCIPFLLFSSYYPLYRVLKALIRSSSCAEIYAALFLLGEEPQIFCAQYPMLSSLFGIFLSLAVIYCLQNYASNVTSGFLALLVGMAIIFKAPAFVALFCGFSLWTLIEVLKTKKLSLLGYPAFSLVVALGLYLVARPAGSATWVLKPSEFFLGSAEKVVDSLGTYLLYMLPGLLLLIFRRKKTAIFSQAWRYPVVFIIPMLIFLQLFGLLTSRGLSGNIYQVLSTMPFFAAMFTITLIMDNWTRLSKLKQGAVLTLTILITLPPFLHQAAHAGILLISPEKGHEYADNRMLAEALAYIPVGDTVIVTNDFRYPAQNYARDLRQFQLPAIFGHQMYASNFKYERYEDSERRLALQYRFRNKTWEPELEHIAAEEGWTHLVIHRLSPHAADIPLALIFENSEYRVYKF